ncbi:MAG: hypothetical protein HRT77_11415 [Halioglobus sp.]|nr:hypothetical protein [Halioglobus sp.]
MPKVVWIGEARRANEADGAWTARDLNGWGHGTGATPSVMGFGEEDRFVAITDGEELINMVLFWREAMPEDWVPSQEAPNRRIAGMLRANMGVSDLHCNRSGQ